MYRMKSIFFFNRFLTPYLATLLYWLGSLSVIGYNLKAMGAGFYGQQPVAGVVAVMTTIFGIMGIRVLCELGIVMFQIHKELVGARAHLRGPAMPSQGAGSKEADRQEPTL